jgi:hypothetical protein
MIPTLKLNTTEPTVLSPATAWTTLASGMTVVVGVGRFGGPEVTTKPGAAGISMMTEPATKAWADPALARGEVAHTITIARYPQKIEKIEFLINFMADLL